MAVIAADAPFRAREGLPQLIGALGRDNARYVGGIVRDTLLGIDAADVDIATSHRPEAVIDLLAAARIRSVPTGLAHGTVTAVLPSGPVEVTTLRRDVATDGRHATVAFSDDWQEDAARRDFTINALYADPESGTVYDWFGGIDDLAAGRVRFIGDSYRRIAEDHLRILRFFRFHARFGAVIDEADLDACTARANDLMALSRERIASELLKLLVARKAVAVVGLMIDRNILRSVVPEIADVAALEALVRREEAARIPPDPIRRLAALLPADAADAVGARLKLSNAARKRLAAARLGAGDEGPRGLVYRVGADSAIDRLLIAGEPIEAIRGWAVPARPVTGGALIARGLSAGPDVAAAMRRIERRWIAEGFPDAARVDQIADEEAGASIASAAAASTGRE